MRRTRVRAHRRRGGIHVRSHDRTLNQATRYRPKPRHRSKDERRAHFWFTVEATLMVYGKMTPEAAAKLAAEHRDVILRGFESLRATDDRSIEKAAGELGIEILRRSRLSAGARGELARLEEAKRQGYDVDREIALERARLSAYEGSANRREDLSVWDGPGNLRVTMGAGPQAWIGDRLVAYESSNGWRYANGSPVGKDYVAMLDGAKRRST